MRALCAILLLATASCAGSFIHPAPSCGPPSFPYAGGWLGADAAYSIPIGGGKSVWLFGDTFVGTPDQRDRKRSSFIHNSIGISQCAPDGSWKIDYAWGHAADGSPRAFLDAERNGAYWWLFDGFVHADRLYIGLLGVEESEPRGPLNLPFRYTGMELARVENYEEDPATWTFEILPLTDNRTAFPGSAMVLHEGYAYLFAFLDLNAERYPRMLSRFPLSALSGNDPGGALETLVGTGRWQKGFDPDHAMILMTDNASEMSVRYHDELGAWLAVYNYPNLTDRFPDVPPSDLVYLRTAQHLEGPWSEPKAIFRIPELAGDAASGRDPNTFCYAAKEHPQYAGKGRLLITYVCNLFTPAGQDAWAVLSRLAERMNLYRPRAISIPFPAFEVD